MRYMGFDNGGSPWIGAVEGPQLRPIAAVDDFYANLANAARQPRGPANPLAEVRQLPAVWAGARILCVGLNYRAHAAEGGFEVPQYPAIFGRWARSLITDGDSIPALDPKLDWECELAVIIGSKMASVSPAAGVAGVFGYAAFNDVSARTYQRHTHQWTPGKNMDRSGVIGPIVSADEIGDPQALAIATRLNGTVMQQANTAEMIFSVGQLISYLSETMTLHPGDVIVTGTPEGVGHARTPPIFMQPGDMIEVEIEKIGCIRNTIVDAGRREG